METLACSVNNNYSPTLHGVTYLTSVWCNGVSSDTPQIIFFVFSKLNPEMKCQVVNSSHQMMQHSFTVSHTSWVSKVTCDLNVHTENIPYK